MNNDGYTDLLYLDETGDGIVDKKIEFLRKVIMFDRDINALFFKYSKRA